MGTPMKKTQLPLIPELAFDPVTTSAPSGVTRPFTGTSDRQYALALIALTFRPIPRWDLDRIAGTAEVPDVLNALRMLGLELPCSLAPIFSEEGKVMHVEVCRFTINDARRVNRWLQTLRGDHA